MVAFSRALLIGGLAASTALAAPPPNHGNGNGPGGPGKDKDKYNKLKPVSSKELVKDIKLKNLMNGAQKLEDIAYATPDRNRLAGTKGHNDTVAYIKKELEALDGYYKVELQPFQTLIMINGTGSLFVDGVDANAGLMEFSPSGEANAPIIVVNNVGCEAADYPATLAGNIALISRGTCEFGLKSVLAGQAGAKAAIIYNNVPGNLSGTLGAPRPEGPYVATVSLPQDAGVALRDRINGGATVTGVIDVETTILNAYSNNVLATTTHGNLNTTLMLGAHTDSVAAGPGINDDGSGTIGILEVAKQLAKYKVNNAVRFGFWTAEEEGLLGSTYYVESLSPAELSNIRAYLNFDMIASPNYILGIYDGDGSEFNLTGPPGSAEIEKFFQDWFKKEAKLPTVSTEFSGRSDYQAFIDNGIPAGGTDTGADGIKTEEQVRLFGGTAGIIHDPNYHQAADNVSNLNTTAFEVNAKAIAAAVGEYATSFKSLPPKAVGKRSIMKRSENSRRAMKKKLALF